MAEMISIPRDDLVKLETRLKKLAMEKSYLQLVNNLMSRLSEVPGVEAVIENMLRLVLDNLGGLNIAVYYLMDIDLFYADVFGKKRKIEKIDDEIVKRVFDTREFMEVEYDFEQTKMLTPEFTKASTWAAPLMVGNELIGVLKLESMQMAAGEIRKQLEPFFQYAALLLKNEISGFSKLKKAYDTLSETNTKLTDEILQRKVAEEALIREREFNRALLESMADGVVACDAEGKLSLFNHKAREWHGMDPIKLPPEEWPKHYDLFRSDGVTPLLSEEVPLARAFRGEIVLDAGMAIVTNGGEARFILANGNVIRDTGGEKLGAVVVMRDVTELRRYEERLRSTNEELEMRVTERTLKLKTALERLGIELEERSRAEEAQRCAFEALRESESRLAEAQRIAHLGHWELDLQRNTLHWSDEVFRIFGLEVQEFGATYDAFLERVHPDDRDLVSRVYSESVKNKTEYDVEHRILRKNGEIRYVNERCCSEYDEKGCPLRSLGTVLDVTERNLIEEKLRELNNELEQRVKERTMQLEEANNELEAFAYSVAHDLRAPLRHIDGFLELLRGEISASLNEKCQDFLTIILGSSKKMGGLIDDLLAFSRLGRSEMLKHSVDFGVLVREVIQDLEPETKGRNIHWDIANLPVIAGDRNMLRQVLFNLLSNALKYTKFRSQAEIEIGRIPGQEAETFFIRDNGVGFDMNYAGKLFGVFQRLHRVEEFEGNGIGLANVRRIINRHAGKIWAEGKENQGATFFFSLPQTIQERENHE
jgi:PAS domain S-box-containing protein